MRSEGLCWEHVCKTFSLSCSLCGAANLVFLGI
jgi:hypothetical protein